MSLMRRIYELLGGRPMRLLSKNSIFYDFAGNVPVGCYQDKIGRYWLGDMSHPLGGWQPRFVPIDHPPVGCEALVYLEKTRL